ncbi:MAG TPA: hypothetical protein PLU88_10535 [Armatimonadota bacterium]|jgi:hypothetical protein|nr:hypothetical protein [Armatimonadota bacterium]HPP75544.1 hypothetical protein [Armatimonadota bacterium]
MQCFDDRKLRQFIQGELSAEEMLSTSKHIQSCPVCRTRLTSSKTYLNAVYSISDVTLACGECPDYEILSAFVEDSLPHEAHQHIERHISLCELCWNDVETLQASRARATLAPEITVQPGQFAQRRSWNIFAWPRLAAATTGVAAVAVVLMLSQTSLNNKPAITKVGDRPAVVARGNTDAPIKIDTPEPRVTISKDSEETSLTTAPEPDKPTATKESTLTTPESVFVAEFKDGSVTVGRSNGKLMARSDGRDFEVQVAALVNQKLRDGQVPSSFQMAKADEVRGPQDIIKIKRLSPLPGSIAQNSPEFTWEPVEGAMKYRVEIYSMDGTAIHEAETEDTRYHYDGKLEGGGYKWVVRVRRGFLADWEWSEAVPFRVMSQKELDLIDQAKRDYPGSHLVLGTIYESLGLNHDAVSEFSALATENPNSPLAAKLLEGARKKVKE